MDAAAENLSKRQAALAQILPAKKRELTKTDTIAIDDYIKNPNDSKAIAGLKKRNIDEKDVNAYIAKKDEERKGEEYDIEDANYYNSLTSTERSKIKDDPVYKKFIKDYNSIMSDKESSIDDIMRYSAGNKAPEQTDVGQLSKFQQALSTIEPLEEQIQKMDTGPILGKLRELNPWDTDAQVLKRNLTSLIPTLAR